MPFFTARDGLKIHYETYGWQEHSANSPCLVMLHGLASSIDLWKPQIDDFKGHFRLLLMDFPGHGDSDNLWFHTLKRYTDYVEELIQSLELDKVHLMALSMGCAVALEYALRHPARTLSLILQGPVGGITPPWSPVAWPKMIALCLYLLTLGTLALIFGKGRLVHFLNVIRMQTRDYHFLLEHVEQKASPLAKIYMTLQIAYPPYIGKLGQIKAPVMVIAGRDDPFPKRYFDYILSHVGGYSEFVEIPGGKHIIALDCPREYNAKCLNFLLTVER